MKKIIKVAAALIKQNDEFLVTRRAYGELKNKWEFPGGKIEEEENAMDTIVREIREELSLDIVPLKKISTFTHEYPFNEIHLTLILCSLKDDNKSVKSDGSHNAYKWINLKESAKIDFAPLDKKVMDHIKVENLI